MNRTRKEELDYIASQLMPTIMERMKEYSVGVGDVELAPTLDGVSSLPALLRTGGVEKVVEVPLEMLTTDIDAAEGLYVKWTEEAKTATAQAQAATGGAEEATELATAAALRAEAALYNVDCGGARIPEGVSFVIDCGGAF